MRLADSILGYQTICQQKLAAGAPDPFRKEIAARLTAGVLGAVSLFALLATPTAWATPRASDSPTGLPIGTIYISDTPGKRASPTVHSTRFWQRFQPLYDTVFTDGTLFSASQMSTDLDALAPLLQGPLANRSEAFLLAATQASVFDRRAMPEQAADAAQRALRIAPRSSTAVGSAGGKPQASKPTGDPLTGSRIAGHRVFLQRQLSRWLAQSGDLEGALRASRDFIKQYSAIGQQKHAESPAYPSNIDVLKAQGYEVYLLHRLGRYDQAIALGQRLLPKARAAHHEQQADRELGSLLYNLAQSQHARGRLRQARQFADEALTLALAHQRANDAYDAYAQLVVLSRELGQPQDAQTWLQAWQRLARERGDTHELAQIARLREHKHAQNGALANRPATPAPGL